MIDQPVVTILRGQQEIATYPLPPDGIIKFGRASSMPEQPDIPLPGEEVSRTQCHIVGRGGVYTIFDGWPGDRKSRNGTMADGQLVSPDSGPGQRIGDGTVVVVPARAQRTMQITLQFHGIALRDEETRSVAEDDLDANTANIGPEGDGSEIDAHTATVSREAWLKVLSGPTKSDLVGMMLDTRIDTKRLAIQGKRYRLEGSSAASLGRGSTADIVLQSPDPKLNKYISRVHAEIRYREEEASYVLINKSPNGTRVGSEMVYTETELKNGEKIAIGDVIFGFHYDQPSKPPWYIRHPRLTRSSIVIGIVAAIVALGALGYVKLMNRVPAHLIQHVLWTANGLQGHDVYSSPALADLNGDGYADVVAAETDGTVVAVDGRTGGQLWNRPPQATSAKKTIGLIRGPLLTADINRDGHPDVIVPSSNMLLVVSNNGSEIWSHDADASSKGFVSGAAVADMDGNGVLDVVTSDGGQGGGGMVLRGENGAVMFQLHNPLSSVPPVLAKINEDDTPDIILSCRGDGTTDGKVEVYDGRTGTRIWQQSVYSGGLTPAGPGGIGAPISAPAVGDLNGDGKPDIVVVTPDYMVVALDGTSGAELGHFAMEGSMFLPPGVAQEPALGAPVLADMNGDGHLDVIVPHLGAGQGGTNYIYVLDGTDISTTIRLYSTGDQVAMCPPALADINHDGIPDIFVELTPFDGNATFRTTSALEILNGARRGRLLRIPTPEGQGRATPLVGDFDHDHRADVFLVTADGTAKAFGLNAPFERGAIAWGSQRGNIRQTGVYRAVAPRMERVLIGIGVAALLLALLMGLLTGIFALMVRRWKRRRAFERSLAGF